jgi:maltooligosyltrehalose synthase
MLRRLMGGSRPDFETRKMFLILRLLGLRGRRPEPFVRARYEPLEAGSQACAFLRGDDVLVVVAVRGDVEGATFEAPGGRWRDVLRGDEHSFDARCRLSDVLGKHGFAVFERL